VNTTDLLRDRKFVSAAVAAPAARTLRRSTPPEFIRCAAGPELTNGRRRGWAVTVPRI